MSREKDFTIMSPGGMRIGDQELIHVAHLKWIINFYYDELDRLDARLIEEKKYKLFEFVRDSNISGSDLDPVRIDNPAGSPGEFVKTVGPPVLSEIQNAVRDALNKLVESHVAVADRKSRRFSAPSITCVSYNDLNPYQTAVNFESDPIGQVLLALYLHLGHSRTASERLSRCDNCQTIFLRLDRKPQRGRGKYCSATCSQAAAMKMFQARKAKEKEAKAAESARAELKPTPAGRAEKRKPKR